MFNALFLAVLKLYVWVWWLVFWPWQANHNERLPATWTT